jgi:hypothetical protein
MMVDSGGLEVLTLHHAAQSIQDSLRCKVLGGDQIDEMLLTFFLLPWPIRTGIISGDEALAKQTFCRML